MSTREYEFHLENFESVFILVSWSGLELEFFTILKIDNFRVHGKVYKSLVSFLYEYFDYTPLICKLNIKHAVESISKLFISDNIQLIGILNTSKLLIEPKYFHSEIVNIFNSDISSFHEVLKKKSIKRKYNTLTSHYNTAIEHHDSDSPIFNHLVDEIIELHKERWAFEGIDSSFIGDNYRDIFYKYKNEQRLISVIRNIENAEIISIHYGFILNNSILWHTPVFNIKYYNFTPIELLLKCMFECCVERGIVNFDLGLGSELYKLRFSNDTKEIRSYFFPLSLKSSAILFGGFKFSGLAKKLLNKVINYKITIKKILNQTSSVKYYEHNSKLDKIDIKEEYCIIKTWEEYCDLKRNFPIELSRGNYERFKRGDVFYMLWKENEVLCSGWGGNPFNFFVLEINKSINFTCDVILYDFNTPIDHQNKGYYKKLLIKIIQSSDSVSCGIFAGSKNHKSLRGILNAGFASRKIYYGWR